jgi:mRNA-degrading endonuclease RelE of RelBE toxin-antitoxin system
LAWTIEYDQGVLADFKKLNRQIQREILDYLKKRVGEAEEPRACGKPLRHSKFGLWRYRVRDSQIICELWDAQLRVLVVAVATAVPFTKDKSKALSTILYGQRIMRSFGGRVTGAMYIHMFAFRFKAGVTDTQKDHVVAEIRKLEGEIPQVLESWVGMNDSPRAQGYEMGGVMKFADKAACEAYGAHPVHQKLLIWLMPLIEPIEVDFPVTA